MKLKHIVAGDLGTNCYILSENNKAIVVDPGGSFNTIDNYLKKNDLEVKYIINTHGHYDHIAENDALRAVFPDLKVIIHENEAEYLTNPMLNFSGMLGKAFALKAAEITVKHNEEFEFEGNTLKFIHTPGHTIGSMCILFDKKLISGDTLFYYSIGRTDLPGGSYEQIIDSVKMLVSILDEDVKVYPGHGDFTSIKAEKANNPFIK